MFTFKHFLEMLTFKLGLLCGYPIRPRSNLSLPLKTLENRTGVEKGCSGNKWFKTEQTQVSEHLQIWY